MGTVTVRWTDAFDEIVWILSELERRLPQLRDNPAYRASAPLYLSSGAYKFLIAGEGTTRVPATDPTAFGFVTFYRAPMQERIVLAVEALWFADADLESQLPVWRAIATLAKHMSFHGVCVAPHGVNAPRALREMVARGDLDGDPVRREKVLLQAEVPGIYSSLADGPLSSAAFSAPCVRIYTLRVPVDLGGVPCTTTGPFYRGEGRVTGPRVNGVPAWDVANMDDLAGWFIRHGFHARDDNGLFTGTVQEQIMHQGYVDQPTVSLTTDRAVAVDYATNGRKNKEGVVFTIDGARLRRYGEIYDSYATMAKHCHWMSRGEFDALRSVVQDLGVLKAGHFLKNCYNESKRRVERYRHLPDVLAPPVDWSRYLDPEDRARLTATSAAPDPVGVLRNAFETFWMFALGQIASVDTITLGDPNAEPRVDTRPAEPFGYYIGFGQVEDRLKAALKRAPKNRDYRQPGWDTTAFGYMAKTCRDEEFFSTGFIPGDCIVAAQVVDNEGNARSFLSN